MLWNSNGLSQHKLELIQFLLNNNVDILLVTETHFTKKSFFNIPNFTTYHTTHPDDKAHGGSAIIIKNKIKHYQETHYRTEEIQATNIMVEDCGGNIMISSVYSPPKHNIKKEMYKQFFKTLGNRFIAGGDYNAKHLHWGSRLVTPKGRQLLAAINDLNLKCASTGEPTYWPTDVNKTPDLIDFFIMKGISNREFTCDSCFDLSSDHSPVIAQFSRQLISKDQRCQLSSKKTNWEHFKIIVQETLNLQIPLKTQNDIVEAVEHFNLCIQQASWSSTPINNNNTKYSNTNPSVIDKLAEKRRARKTWQQTRHPTDKTILNKATKELKKLLEKENNDKIKYFLENLAPTASSDYSLFKATKMIKAPITPQPPILKTDNTWAKSNQEKADVFASYLEEVFRPNVLDKTVESLVTQRLDEVHQLDLPIKKFTCSEIKIAISNLKDKKAPGYDLINPKILKELPEEGKKFLTQLFNAVVKLCYMPPQWKVAQITMILKPGKKPSDPKSYRPISLLPVASKLLESLFLKRLMPIIDEKKIIPQHQFGFRKNHSTIEQVHRLVEEILKCFELKNYCTTAFLDISQAFDRVWHDGLLYKLKNLIPINFYMFIKTYLENRMFFVKNGEDVSRLHAVSAGVPQGSVMGPILYLLFTSDLPISDNVLTGTFADDTAILSTDPNPARASIKLQKCLDKVITWSMKWGIRTNESKSVQVTFTTREASCPPVQINGTSIPQASEAKYLGIYLDRKLNWKKHIFTKRKALGLQYRKLFWLLNRNSRLSIENKILLYHSILKPIWTYGIQLWGTAANSNLEILQRFQSKILRAIAKAPRYISNDQLHKEFNIKTVKEEISQKAQQYRTRINNHPNELASQLMNNPTIFRRLKRKAPQNL